MGARGAQAMLIACSPAGDSPEHAGLVHAALPEHAVVASGAVSARGGCNAVSAGPLQVSAMERAGPLRLEGGQNWQGWAELPLLSSLPLSLPPSLCALQSIWPVQGEQ